MQKRWLTISKIQCDHFQVGVPPGVDFAANVVETKREKSRQVFHACVVVFVLSPHSPYTIFALIFWFPVYKKNQYWKSR